jgi:exodeoxyribonuclease V beta subunit
VKTLKQFQIASTSLEPGVTLIEASAGTGKTFTIAGIVLRLVLELRIPIDQILAVTYTVAATEELRDRVRKRLQSALGDLRLRTSDDDVVAKYLEFGTDIEQGIRDLDLAVQNFDEARIFTIHGFCQRVLHDYAFESGMLFDTELLTDPRSIFEGVAQDFWRKQFYEGSAFLSWLAIARDRSPSNWIGLLQQTLNHPDLIILPGPELESAVEIGKQVEKKFEEIAEEWSASGAAVSRILREDTNLSRDKNSNFGGDKVNQIEAGLAALSVDFRWATSDSLNAIDQVSRSQIERSIKRTCTPPRHRFFDLCEDYCNLTRRYFHQLDHDFMAFARREIPRQKARLNVLTYDDLLMRLRDALKGEAGETLAKALGGQYRAALIDEFQDTDPVQYDIFRGVFASGQPCLFLIGDPKQAIYGFRGADVFTYLHAAGEASLAYTLNVNYRSEKRLLEAVNILFGNVERPFLIEGIEYRPVSPAKKSREGFLELVERTSDGPLRFRFLRSDDKKFNQTDAESHINRAIAADIARLRAGGAQLGGRPLRFGDMAVLVRSNAQAANLQNVLRASGIKSVLKAEDSVFKEPEARETLRLLEAVLEPGRDILLRTALTTRLIGLNAAEILAFDSAEDQWQGWLEKFLDYRSRWENACFIALFRYVFVDQKVRERLVRYPGGERVLTNFLHIAELLHRAETEQRLSPDALCVWLREHIGDSVNTSDEDQLRLESDDDAVLLATVHKSKGLEYPVVFCPFLWKAGDTKNRSKILFHDPANDNRLTLDLRTMRPDPDDNNCRAGEECMAESLRALYVALTRAQNRCYVYTGEILGFDTSPLAHVLGSASSLPGLEALEKKSGGSIAVTVIDPAEDLKAKVYPSQTELVENLSARHFSGSIRRAQMIASFTGLTSGRAEEEPDRDAVELPEQVADTGDGQNGLAGFQGGIRAGVFLHDVLEHLDFQAPDQIEQLVRLKLATHGIAGNDWKEAFCAQLRILLETPLEPDLTLSQISLAERLSEVEFSYPIASLQPDQLQELFVKHGSPEIPREFPESLGRLYLQTEGFMRGFIDLLFRFGKRYYLIDWKSNWLGNRPGDYDEAAVRACMLQHSYFLQYHLYTVAADLYLSSRIGGYEYDKHFGGVFYVFFRGLDAKNPKRAIFRDRPRASLVSALRQLLIHGLS